MNKAFINRWGWGRGDQVSHFYVQERLDPNYARSACSTRLNWIKELGKVSESDDRCRQCARSKAARF